MGLALAQFTPAQACIKQCVLRQSSIPVDFSRIGSEKLRALIKDLLRLLYENPPGVGLAAPMAGILLRVAVIDLKRDATSPLILINPKLGEVSTVEEEAPEGNLCLPRYYCSVKRPKQIILTATDIRGNPYELESSGFEARVILHEMEILDGIMYFDRLETLDQLKDRGSDVLANRAIRLLGLND